MNFVFEARGLTRKFGRDTALDALDINIPKGSVVGLIGKNGSGKTTLLDHILGLRLPTAGSCKTFGVSTEQLTAEELGRIGAVHQENRLLGWMSVENHIRYVAAYHSTWDASRERLLLEKLEIDPKMRVHKLTPGNAQKLALLMAMCPHPDLLLLDEPISALDPIARESLLTFLLDLVREDQTTVIISSHVLRDIERIVDRVICLDRGRVKADAELDELLESYGEWRVTSLNGGLPAAFREEFIIQQEVDSHNARLVVRQAETEITEFEQRHNAQVDPRSLNLESIFPHLVGKEI